MRSMHDTTFRTPYDRLDRKDDTDDGDEAEFRLPFLGRNHNRNKPGCGCAALAATFAAAVALALGAASYPGKSASVQTPEQKQPLEKPQR